MNKIFIIGNLVRDPELRTTQSGIPVCTFTVAVNRRKQGAEAGQQEADFFRVTTWRQMAENCNRYLAKGRKVAVAGAVSLNTYTAKDGTTKASLEVNADEVEFLSPKDAAEQPKPPADEFIQVDDQDESLPF
jgi:single-strand DNA-binding protein